MPMMVRRAQVSEIKSMFLIEGRAQPAWSSTSEGLSARVERFRVRHEKGEGGLENLLVALKQETVVGWANVSPLRGFRYRDGPKTYIAINVDPEHQGLGVGSALWKAARDHSSHWEAIAVKGGLIDNEDSRSLEIAQHWGFRVAIPPLLESGPEDMMPLYFLLDISQDTVNISNSLAEKTPYEIRELELPDLNTSMAQDLHAAHDHARVNALSYEEYEPVSFDVFCDKEVKRIKYGGGSLIALRGNEVLGATMSQRCVNKETMYTEFTFVRPECSGAGLGAALKASLTIWAHQKSIARIRTESRSDNVAMIAVHKKLGYRTIGFQQIEMPFRSPTSSGAES